MGKFKVIGHIDAQLRADFIAHTFLRSSEIRQKRIFNAFRFILRLRCCKKVSTIHSDHRAGDECEETENWRIIYDYVQR